MTERYDILKETHCLYCQVEYASPAALQLHVLDEHEGTTAAYNIRRRRAEVRASG